MIIFMGVAGAGKSAQGRLLADKAALPWLSTGEFLRMLISGEHRKDMLRGKLLSDREMISLVQKIFAVVDTEHEFVLDGFPRTRDQAEWLLTQIRYGQLDMTAVMHVVISEDVVRQRLLARGRQDDTEEAIAERFREYRELTQPIIEQFRTAGVPVHEINGEGSVEQIHQQVLQQLGYKED
ncbi:hypothetical protein CR970_01820 [Candidatus Saccharibacteria bacterium]|nr:MAG: hypothetical protein CR970_01820 [Candidatus Saccharibacteria bacterium]